MDDSNPVVGILLLLLSTAPLWFGGVSLLWRFAFGAKTGPVDDEATKLALRRLHQTGAADRLLGVGWSIAPTGRDAEFNSDAGVLSLVVTRRVPLVGPRGRGTLSFEYRRDGQGITFEGRVTTATATERI